MYMKQVLNMSVDQGASYSHNEPITVNIHMLLHILHSAQAQALPFVYTLLVMVG